MAGSAVMDDPRFVTSEPGNPLGRGMPLGATLRLDGESHRQAWMRIVRADPCAYCGALIAGTVDHIEPKSLRVKGLGGAHSWINLTGACEACNGNKAAKSLLTFLWTRHRARVFRPKRLVGSPQIPTEEAA